MFLPRTGSPNFRLAVLLGATLRGLSLSAEALALTTATKAHTTGDKATGFLQVEVMAPAQGVGGEPADYSVKVTDITKT